MKPSSALIIGGAYLSYTIASWSPERREAVVEMIRDGVGGAVNAFREDPLGCLRRFWDEKKRSPMLLLALASKLMADNLRRKRLKREAAQNEAHRIHRCRFQYVGQRQLWNSANAGAFLAQPTFGKPI